MKKILVIAMLLVGSTQVHAAKGDNSLSYLSVLLQEDIVRVFWSPCRTEELGKVEKEEIALYESQGFVLAAKIVMPQGIKRFFYPECQYTFVRKSHLK